MPLASSASPFVTTTTSGCQIAPVVRDYLKASQDFDFNFHVFNTSNGAPLSNSTLSCYFHLYNQTGDHFYTTILHNDPYTEHNVINEWVGRIGGGNFSTIGSYAYLVQCNGTIIYGGCADKGLFIITKSGNAPAGDSLTIFIYILFILSSLILFYTFFLTIAKLVTADQTIYDVLIAWSGYILVIIVNYIAGQYLLTDYVELLTAKFLTYTVYTNGVLPLIAFILSFFIKSTQKKRVLTPQEVGGFRYG